MRVGIANVGRKFKTSSQKRCGWKSLQVVFCNLGFRYNHLLQVWLEQRLCAYSSGAWIVVRGARWILQLERVMHQTWSNAVECLDAFAASCNAFSPLFQHVLCCLVTLSLFWRGYHGEVHSFSFRIFGRGAHLGGQLLVPCKRNRRFCRRLQLGKQGKHHPETMRRRLKVIVLSFSLCLTNPNSTLGIVIGESPWNWIDMVWPVRNPYAASWPKIVCRHPIRTQRRCGRGLHQDWIQKLAAIWWKKAAICQLV